MRNPFKLIKDYKQMQKLLTIAMEEPSKLTQDDLNKIQEFGKKYNISAVDVEKKLCDLKKLKPADIKRDTDGNVVLTNDKTKK